MFGLFKRSGSGAVGQADVIHRDWPDVVYAIGDVHGCLSLLRDLHVQIMEDCDSHGGRALVIYLGDYIDRGEDSAGVLDLLTSPQVAGPEVVFLTGNHEAMMLDFLAKPQPDHIWLRNGGAETLLSYGLDPSRLFDGGRRLASQRLVSHIPGDHIAFLQSLALCVSLPGMTFVHAGLAPNRPIQEQSASDMIWMRPTAQTYTSPQPFGRLVHGHTPATAPVVEPSRICVDTGAFATGVLTGARLTVDGSVSFISATLSGRLSS